MEEKSNNTITIRKDTLWKYSTFVLGALVIVLVATMFFGDNGGVTGNVVKDPTVIVDPRPSTVTATADDDAILGDEDAEVTIIEFSDYQCPFCERFWSQTLPQIKTQYIETGKVKFVYRDLPLVSIHPNAQPAAEATECVRDKGGDKAFWQMHDKIFGNQQALSVQNLKAWAKELGYDISSCLDSGEFASEVQKDMQDAAAAGGQGTPYFVIVGSDGKGTALSGAQPFTSFQTAIEAKL